MNRKILTTMVIAGALMMIGFVPAVSAHEGEHENWFSYEVGPTMTPAVGIAGTSNDPTGTTTDGTLENGGAIVCNWDTAPTTPDDYNCADTNGNGDADFIVDYHTEVEVTSLDDVWGPNVRSDACVDGNNDSICVDQPEEPPEERTDAQTILCSDSTGTLDYEAQNTRADNNDSLALGDAVVFLAGVGNQGIIDENNPDPFRCPVLPAPSGATTGGVLSGGGPGGPGITFDFAGSSGLDPAP